MIRTHASYLLHHILRASASRTPEKEALVFGDVRMSYAELERRAAALAGQLREIGLKRGDRIGIYLPSSVEQVISIFGVSQAGGVFVPMNAQLFPLQVSHIAEDCQITVLVTSISAVETLAPQIENLSALRFIVVVADAVLPDATSPEVNRPMYDFEILCDSPALTEEDDVGISKDLAALVYTSGSTGKPKGVMLTHAQILAGTSIVSQYLEITASDRILSVLPLSFDAGLNQLTTAIQAGGTLILTRFKFAIELIRVIRDERITGLAGVPTLWNLMAGQFARLNGKDYTFLRYVTNTGGPMPQHVLEIVRRVLPETQIFLMYGLTEAFRSTYLSPEEVDRRPTSIGKAIPDTEILLLDDSGELCLPGEMGELVHRGPTVSLGYWGQPELTARVLRPNPLHVPEMGEQELVCYSGDLATMDEDGFIYFVGRRDTLIKSAGFRISPNEVEAVLIAMPMIRLAAVIGVPDEILGQVIHAFVVMNDDFEFEEDVIKDNCSAEMPAYMVPRKIVCVEALPLTPSGKVDYTMLKNERGT